MYRKFLSLFLALVLLIGQAPAVFAFEEESVLEEIEVTVTPEATVVSTPEVTTEPTSDGSPTPTPDVTPTPVVTPEPTAEVTVTPTPEVIATPIPESTAILLSVAANDMIASGGMLSASWYIDQSGTLTFEIDNGNDLTIPDSSAGMAPWYQYRDSIKEIIFIGSGYLEIGAYSFYGLNQLKRVLLPDGGCKKIGDSAFENCINLKQIYLWSWTGSLEIGNRAFYNCSSLEETSFFVDSVIGEYAFSGCENLDAIYLLCKSNWSISANSYSFHPASTSFSGVNATVFYPEGYKNYITLSYGGTLSWETANYGICGNDAKWKFDTESEILTISGTGNIMSVPVCDYFPWRIFMESVSGIVVEEGICKIPDYCFEYMTKAVRVDLPTTLTWLSVDAFNRCTSLNNLLLPYSLSHIEGYNLAYCDSLTEIYFIGTLADWLQVDGGEDTLNYRSNVKEFNLHCLELYEIEATCSSKGVAPHYLFDNYHDDSCAYPIIYDKNKNIIESLSVTDEIPHSYSTYQSNNDATCSKDGTKTAYCDYGCGTTETITDDGSILGHSYGAWTQVKEPSCVNKGSEQRICTVTDCGATETRDIDIDLNAHNLKVGAAQSKTCTQDGWDAYEYCFECDYTTQIIIPAGHTIQQGTAQTKSCTQDGWAAYEYCTECDYTTKVVIPAGHVIKQGIAQTKSCIQDGWDAYEYCSECDYTTKVIIPSGHAVKQGTAQTKSCTQDGWDAYEYCSECDYTTKVIIPAGHTIQQGNAQTKTCTQDGWATYEYCTECGYTTKVVIPAGHVIQQGVAQTKTCTQDGWDAYEYCSECDYTTKAVIPSGHVIKQGVAQTKSCTQGGWAAYEYCTECDYTTKVIIPAGHVIMNGTAQTKTCTQDGWATYEYCSECDYTTKVVVPAGHVEVIDYAIAPSNTKYGLTEGSHCSKCSVIIKKQGTIPAVSVDNKMIEEFEQDFADIDALVSLSQEIVVLDLENEIMILETDVEDYTESTRRKISSLENSLGDLRFYSKNDLERKISYYAKEVSDLEKIIAAYSGDNSEETKAKVQKYKVQLKTAKENLDYYQDALFVKEEIELLEYQLNDYEAWAEAQIEEYRYILTNEKELLYSAYELINKGETEFYKKSELCLGFYSDEQIKDIYETASRTIELYGNDVEEVICFIEGRINSHEHNFVDGFCTTCGAEDPSYVAPTPNVPDELTVIRIAGAGRSDTAIKAADMLKAQLGGGEFDSIIIANGLNFADALAGSYLAAVKSAPILLYSNAASVTLNEEYIMGNLSDDGIVYLLGGSAAVPNEVENRLVALGITVNRLAGSNRYGTNLAILAEAGTQPGNEILVATAMNFADSLSASATGKPILLVNGKGSSLSADQRAYLAENGGGKITILGGTGAVSASIEEELREYGAVKRLSGKNRYETSTQIAEEYFGTVDTVLIAYGLNFPDGLSGGPVAYALGCPLLLTQSGSETYAQAYIMNNSVSSGYVLGGTGVLSDITVAKAFGFNYSEEDCYDLAEKACDYIKTQLLYPNSFDLVSAEAGMLNGDLAVYFSYFALNSSGGRDWILEAYTCNEINGRIVSWSIWNPGVNYTSYLDLDTKRISR